MVLLARLEIYGSISRLSTEKQTMEATRSLAEYCSLNDEQTIKPLCVFSFTEYKCR